MFRQVKMIHHHTHYWREEFPSRMNYFGDLFWIVSTQSHVIKSLQVGATKNKPCHNLTGTNAGQLKKMKPNVLQCIAYDNQIINLKIKN